MSMVKYLGVQLSLEDLTLLRDAVFAMVAEEPESVKYQELYNKMECFILDLTDVNDLEYSDEEE